MIPCIIIIAFALVWMLFATHGLNLQPAPTVKPQPKDTYSECLDYMINQSNLNNYSELLESLIDRNQKP